MNTLLEYVDDLIYQSRQNTPSRSFLDKHGGKVAVASALGAGLLAHKAGIFDFQHKNGSLFTLPSGVTTDKNLFPSTDPIDYSKVTNKVKDIGGILASGAGKAVKFAEDKIGKATDTTTRTISKKFHEVFDPSNLHRNRELYGMKQTRDLYRSLKNQASLDKLSEKIRNHDS